MTTTRTACTIPTADYQLSSAERDANAGRGHSYTHCWLCGRNLKGAIKMVVNETDDGLSNSTVEGPGHHGFFGIGPECARKLPKGFAHKL